MKQAQLDDSSLGKGLDAAAFEARRVPLERKVILKFHHFGGFFVEYSANVSLTGMFIKTESPKPAGSVFIFEVWLGDEYKLVHGLGEVVWLREKDEGPGRPTGMGIRFLKMDDESRKVIERIIAEHVQKGGEVFDLGTELPEGVDEEVRDNDDPASALADALVAAAEGDDLLELDEQDLKLEVPLEETSAKRRRAPQAPRSRHGLRVAVLLAALALALGGVAYLFGAGILTF